MSNATPLHVAAPTPRTWRLGILVVIAALTFATYQFAAPLGSRGRAAMGVLCFFGVGALFSTNLRAVSWRTIFWGVALQVLFAVLVLKVDFVQRGFQTVGTGVKKFIGFSDQGAKFVFGNLYDPRPVDLTEDGMETTDSGTWARLFRPFKAYDKEKKQVVEHSPYAFQFAFVALPPILFVSAFFTMLYHFGVLQLLVKALAKLMVYLMGTSGAETLSVAANVFMGQTEAPLIVKPYVPRMTKSELYTLMVSGMAHISGGLMAVYINYGADPVAVITTCVMACPCSLYLAKLILPEVETPETGGTMQVTHGKSPYSNAIDAIASGTGDGLKLALNVAAMLIVFVAFVYFVNALLVGLFEPVWMRWNLDPETIKGLHDNALGTIFGKVFSPVAMLMGVDPVDQQKVGTLLGTKLSLNEHVAYLNAKFEGLLDVKNKAGEIIKHGTLLKRSQILTAFALTGFANFASIGIQLGGIGAMAPERRHDLAKLGGKALFAGFLATILNAALAGIFIPEVVQ